MNRREQIPTNIPENNNSLIGKKKEGFFDAFKKPNEEENDNREPSQEKAPLDNKKSSAVEPLVFEKLNGVGKLEELDEKIEKLKKKKFYCNKFKDKKEKKTQKTEETTQDNKPKTSEVEATLESIGLEKSELTTEGRKESSGEVIIGPEANQLMREQYQNLTGENLERVAITKTKANAEGKKKLYKSKEEYVKAKEGEVREEAKVEEFFSIGKYCWDAMSDEEKEPYFKDAQERDSKVIKEAELSFMQELDKEWESLQGRDIQISKESYYGLIQKGYRPKDAKVASFIGFFKKIKIPNFDSSKKGLKMPVSKFSDYISELHDSITEKIEETTRAKLDERVNRAIERYKKNIERSKKIALEDAIKKQEIENKRIKNADFFDGLNGLLEVLDQKKATEHKHDIDKIITIITTLRSVVEKSVREKNHKEIENYLSVKTGAALRLLDGIEGLRDKVRELLIKENNIKVNSEVESIDEDKARKIKIKINNAESLEATYNKGGVKFKVKSRKK